MDKKIIHSILICLTIIIAFSFNLASLSSLAINISIALFLIYVIIKRFILHSNPYSKLLDSIVFTFIVISIVNSTGGVDSPMFFLLYFLLFSLSLLLDPSISMTLTLVLILMFLLSLPKNQNIKTLLPIFSLAFLTPFSLFMGKEFLENQKSKVKNQIQQQDTFLFLSLMLKNQLKAIKHSLDNFLGDHQLEEMKKNTAKMEKLIEEFEKKY